jgi:GNAT superfamily N-acetyltransferase
MVPLLELADTVDAAVRDVIGQGLNDYNDALTPNDRREMAIIVREAAGGKIVGGIIGRSSLGLLFIDLVYLPMDLRGGGVGSRMLRMAEDEGARRGCVSALLYTISFQAPGFYERHGWKRFGEIPCLPPGTSRVFMTKILAPPPAAPPPVAAGH